MSHILHLGHQVTDLAGVAGRISTDAAGFDAGLDVNCVRISTDDTVTVPFSAAWAFPATTNCGTPYMDDASFRPCPGAYFRTPHNWDATLIARTDA
jgi:hypothetical protein